MDDRDELSTRVTSAIYLAERSGRAEDWAEVARLETALAEVLEGGEREIALRGAAYAAEKAGMG